jgi:hypothetical protein
MNPLDFIPTDALIERLIVYRSKIAKDRQRDVIDALVAKALDDLSVFEELTTEQRSALAVKMVMEALK